MLVRFSIENFRSFYGKQIFSMAAGNTTRFKNHLISFNDNKILKGSVFFGANASGKSNLIKAIDFGKKVVLNGIKPSLIFGNNFRVDENALKKPGVFQYDFISNNHIYSYGFAISYEKNIFLEEWLYLCDNNKEKLVFSRTLGQEIYTELDFKQSENSQRFNIYANDVNDNKSFISEIIEHKLNDIPEFSPFFDTYKWFSLLFIIFPQSRYTNLRRFMANSGLASFENLLHYFDTGIEEITSKESSVDKALSFLPEELKTEIIHDVNEAFDKPQYGTRTAVEITIRDQHFNFIKKASGEIFVSQLRMNHGNKNDLFELKDESDGTRRLFDLIPIFQKGLGNAVIIVDELDRSFHTKLTEEFIRMFYEKTQRKSSQLIVTTHDSNLINLDLFRKDEIWFVQRERDHSSFIYSLNKFKDLVDTSVEKDYLLGRYGSLPIFNDVIEESDE